MASSMAEGANACWSRSSENEPVTEPNPWLRNDPLAWVVTEVLRIRWYTFSSRDYEMQKSFVAVNDWCHQLLRELTQRTPLVVTGLENGLDRVEYQIVPELLPQSYFSLVACHTLDGLPLEQVRLGCWRVRDNCKPAVLKAANGFDATRLDRRCWGDLRLKPAGGPTALVSGELLVFGAGMLRGDGVSGRHGKLSTQKERIFTRIWALRREGPPALTKIQKRIYESTNLIYGDALGELEQLWNRRADTAFLDKVARVLADVGTWAPLPTALHSPLNAAAVIRLHRRAQGIWNTPPRSGRALLRRLEFILGNTTINKPEPRYNAAPLWSVERAEPGMMPTRTRSTPGYDDLFSGNVALN
jgi:hypothetical protein